MNPLNAQNGHRGQVGVPQICSAVAIWLEVGLPRVGGSNQILVSTELVGALSSKAYPSLPQERRVRWGESRPRRIDRERELKPLDL